MYGSQFLGLTQSTVFSLRQHGTLPFCSSFFAPRAKNEEQEMFGLEIEKVRARVVLNFQFSIFHFQLHYARSK
jgi:hypothetical protein